MASRRFLLLPAGKLAAIGLLAAMVAGMLAVPVTAAEPQLPASLKWVPADVAFYSASLRLGEQVEIVAESNAWKAIRNLPAVRDALDQLQQRADQPGTPAASFMQAMDNPQVKGYLATLCDMFSKEVFFFGDGAWGDLIRFFQDLGNGTRLGTVIAFLEDPENAMNRGAEEIQAATALAIAAESIDDLRVPTSLMGFKLDDSERADQQLRAMAGLMQFFTISVPQLQGRFRQQEIAGGTFYVLSLDGKMVPEEVWADVEAELENAEAETGQAEKIVRHLRKLTLVIAVGLRDDWLLVFTGPSTELLASLGEGDLLADRAEMKPLRQFADRKLIAVSYASEDFRRKVGGTAEDLEGFLELADALLEETDLSSAEKTEIRNDTERLVDRAKKITPQLGAVLSFTFLTDQGMESYAYNWSRGLRLDGSKPLGLLQHLGGNPLLALVARGTNDELEYDLVADLVATACKYIDRYLPKELDPEEREEYEKVKDLIVPLGRRVDRVTRELFLPALADGQAGIVLDAGLRVRNLHRELPTFDQPMPLPAAAVVMGVSDAEKFTEAGEKYFDIINDFLAGLHEMEPDEVPELKIPVPEITESATGTIYAWALPTDLGLTKEIAPNIGVGKNVAVVSYSPAQTERLLQSKPLEVGGVLEQTDQPAAVAGCLDIAGLIEAVRPWVHMILTEENAPDEVVEQVDTVIEVLKSLRMVTSRSYFDGDVLVTHTLLEICDLP